MVSRVVNCGNFALPCEIKDGVVHKLFRSAIISTHGDNLAHFATAGEPAYLGDDLNGLGYFCRYVVAIRLLMRTHC
jgi:hypothetical protein